MPCTELFRTIRAVATAFLSPKHLTTPASSIAPRVDTEQAISTPDTQENQEAPPPALDLPGKYITTHETWNDGYSLLPTTCAQIIFNRA